MARVEDIPSFKSDPSSSSAQAPMATLSIHDSDNSQAHQTTSHLHGRPAGESRHDSASAFAASLIPRMGSVRQRSRRLRSRRPDRLSIIDRIRIKAAGKSVVE